MSQLQNHSLPQDKFLTLSVNLLHRAFIEAPRTEAKKLYRVLDEGRVINLTNVEMEDKSTLILKLALDHTEYRGSLNYSAFRDSVATLVSSVVQTLQEEKEFPTFTSEQGEGGLVFGIPAITVEESQPNVMVLAADPAARDASLVLRLMYLDPEQFVETAAAG